MFTSPNPKQFALGCFLICALFVTGLIVITRGARRVASHHLPPAAAPPAGAPSGQQTAPLAWAVDEETHNRVSEVYDKLPLSFEENRGQVDAEVRYVSRGAGYTLFLTPAEAVLSLQRPGGGGRKEGRGLQHGPPDQHVGRGQRQAKSAVLRMKLKGANGSPAAAGEDVMTTRTNYFIGNDPKNWHTDVARFARVRYSQVYPGIDVIYYGEQRQLEYDFEVSPGVDSRQIALEFAGVEGMRVEDATGDLVLTTAGGDVRQHKPVAYQEEGGVRREVASRYVLNGGHEVGIEVGEYDRTKPLVIDPVLSYSTYLGGTIRDIGTGIAVDAAGMVYVTGWTQSFDFPTRNQYQTNQEYTDAFVTKLNPNLSGAASLVYSTYLGGNVTLGGFIDGSSDYGAAIAVDSSGNAYVTGNTNTIDFPTRNQYQAYSGVEGDTNAFVTKLDTNLTGDASLVYSTYLGGSEFDAGRGIAVDAAGMVYVAGTTASPDFPTRHQYQANKAGVDGFVTKLDTNLAGDASLVYSTYLGGSNLDACNAIALDSDGNAYMTGITYSFDFPKRNHYQKFQGRFDAFMTKLDPNLSGADALVYSTFLGGSGGDIGHAIAVDGYNAAYVTGYTDSTNFPTAFAYQPNLKGPADAFVAKIETSYGAPQSLSRSTYLGGSGGDYGSGIAAGSDGMVYVTGSTDSTDFPRLNQLRPRSNDEFNYSDAFVTKLDTNTSDGERALFYSTYLGGNRWDHTHAIAVDSDGNAYVTGETWSSDIPLLRQFRGWPSGYWQTAFVTKLRDTVLISGQIVRYGANDPSGSPLGAGGVTVTLSGTQSRTTVTNRDGKFFFGNLQKGGTYTVTFSRGAIKFSPPRLHFANLDWIANDLYVKTVPVRISGRVTLGTDAGAGLGGVTMTLASGPYYVPRTVTTTSTGAYTFDSVPTPGNYTITPSKLNYSFSPVRQSVRDLEVNRSGVNFVARPNTSTVRGVVKLGADALGGVTVKVESPTPAGRD